MSSPARSEEAGFEWNERNTRRCTMGPMRARFAATFAVCSSLLIGAAAASCHRENVHTATLSIAGEDGGALNGFACVEPSEVSSTKAVSCVLSTCFERCRTERGAAYGDCFRACSEDDGGAGARATCSPRNNLGPPLMLRANGKPVCAVVDYLRIGGEVECRSPFALVSWCRTPEHGGCPVIERHVHPLILPNVPLSDDAGAAQVARAVDTLYAAVHEELTRSPTVSTAGPDEWIVARVFVSTQDCPTLERSTTQIDPEQVLGCAYSCTVLLRDREEIPLLLDNGLTTCQQPFVEICGAFGTGQLAPLADALRQGAAR
jgi:hypothetical protein